MFLEDFQHTTREAKENIESHSKERGPDTRWAVSTLQAVAPRHLAGGQLKEGEATRRASLGRRQLLSERRKWRLRAGDQWKKVGRPFDELWSAASLGIWELGKVLKKHKR